ncbi:MAG: LCP family protein [Actinobacteria bacterium]|nr:LCP family protein [Actinomycetota bacterium]
MRRKSWSRSAFLVLALAIAAACAVMLVDPWNWFDGGVDAAVEISAFPGVEEPLLVPVSEPLSQQSFNVLILGLDHGLDREENGNQRSDVMMIAHVDEAMGRVCLLSIPRDSYVSIPGYRTTKINEAYQAGGAELAVKTVEQLTGMDIRNYVVMDFDEFTWLVDLFGGVQVTLSEPLSDPKLGYIGAGSQMLDGDLALVMARSRDYPQGDLERVRQQQRLLIQILYKGKELASYPGAAWFLSVALEPLETDLTSDEVIRIARQFATFPVVDVQGGVVPGRTGMAGGASVFIVEEAGLRELVSSIQDTCMVPEEYR